MQLTAFRKGNLDISIYDALTTDTEISLADYLSGYIEIEYLKLIEDTSQKDLTFRYVLVRDSDKKLKAFFYYQLLKFSDKNLNLKGNLLLRLFSMLLLRIRPVRLLISGNLFAVNFPVIKFDSSALSPSDIIDMIFEMEKLHKSDVLMIKDLDESITHPEMISRGFEKYEADLTMSMMIKKEWKTIEDYFNVLKKKYRKRAEKIRMAGSTLVRKELNAEEIQNQSERIRQLFQNVSDRQPIRMGQIEQNYFFEFKKRFPHKLTFAGFYSNDRLVSFVTYVDHNEIMEVHFIGIDYDINPSMMLYFNLLFDALETGIKLGKEQLELGRTAREAKATLGAEPVYFNDYLRYNSRIAILLSGFISRQFQNTLGEVWALRSPFKY